ncbi:MAG: hypothetical protein U9R32_03930 [Bacteroidota bacterium]|nr:hypothetical protein [Bacteroidota bacterium]
MAISNNIQRKSNFELLDMVNKKYKYSEEVLINLLYELEKRDLSNDRIDDLKEDIKGFTTKVIIPKQDKEETASETQSSSKETALPQLYSIKAIFMVSIIFSVFFAAILMAINLYNLGKKKTMIHLLSLGFLFSLSIAMLTQSLGAFGPIIGVLLNVGGAYLIVQYFWIPAIGAREYEKKSMLIPIIVGIVISIPIVIIMFQQGMVI